MGSKTRAVIGFAGAMIFFFGIYILPFGTDFWMYFFVEKVAGGNWVLGTVLANVAAFALIVAGAVILWYAGKSPIKKYEKEDDEIIIIRPKKGRKRK